MYLGGFVDCAEDVQKGGLTASRITQNYDELSRMDFEGDAPKGGHSLHTQEVGFVDVAGFYDDSVAACFWEFLHAILLDHLASSRKSTIVRGSTNF